MPIIKFVNESEKIEYPTEQDVCSLLCYAFAPQKTIMNDNQFVGCKPFGFQFWYMRNPLAVHQFMEFNHKRQFKHRKDLAKHRVISFSKEENAEIDHDNLTSEQKTHYDQLNKSCTDTISAKMRQLEYKDNIDYNKKAVNAYNSAFTSFKNNESRYKDKSQLFGLVSTTLFAYDAGRLFNETLIFYNHVYSYIFSKLDDNGKLELTRYSIECERKLR